MEGKLADLRAEMAQFKSLTRAIEALEIAIPEPPKLDA